MNLDRRHFLAGAAGASSSWLATGAAAADAGLRAAASAPSEPRPWPRGRPTPALALPAWAGPPLALSALRGRPVLLNFWASWCEPCRAEMPSLELLAARHEAEGLRVLTINHRESDAAVARFIEQAALSLPVLRDRDGAAARAFGVRVLPASVLVARDGRAAFSVVGEVDWTGEPARRWLAPWLRPAAPSSVSRS